MKTLILIIAQPVLLVIVLRSELTPWRLLSPGEIAVIQTRMNLLEKQAQPAGPGARAQSSSGRWMFDGKYRTSLEKTTVIGRPEAAKGRD